MGAQDELNSFLATAEDLKVKGLSGSKTVDQNTNKENQTQNIFPNTNPANNPPADGKRYETSSEKQQRVHEPCFPQTIAINRHEGEISDIEDVDPVKFELEEDSPDPSYMDNDQYVVDKVVLYPLAQKA